MWTRRQWMLAAAPLIAQEPAAQTEPPAEFLCPMDKDIRTKGPGKCPRCGMALVANLPEPLEYGLRLTATPALVRPGQPVTLDFEILDPKTGRRVTKFEVMHERLFHLFLIGHKLDFFAHEHPDPLPDGRFRFRTSLPRPGAYRVVCDFYPQGGTPQFLARTLITTGAQPADIAERTVLEPSLAPRRGGNLEVELAMEPAHPLAGLETLLFFRLRPPADLQQYLGAWGHLLAASDDLIDVIHDHPLYVTDHEDARQIQFNLLFPRERNYRVWVQFQRAGLVNTVSFNIPVKALR